MRLRLRIFKNNELKGADPKSFYLKILMYAKKIPENYELQMDDFGEQLTV